MSTYFSSSLSLGIHFEISSFNLYRLKLRETHTQTLTSKWLCTSLYMC
uniref:Uncharacterized protein n=1 Tax=Oryza barthii TaxID=65489 RepID=A0A0D3GKN0_9ORYZ